MPILYPIKAKTQGHLRTLMLENYHETHNSLISGKAYHISHTTILKWHLRFLTGEGLENRSSAPITPHRTHELDHLYLLYYLYKVEGNTVSEIEDYFEKNTIVFPRSTIYYHLKNWGLIQERREKGKRINGKFKKYEPGFIHVDITYCPVIDGKKYYIHIVIDRATRILYIELHDNKRAQTAASFLENAIAFFPFIVRKVLTDNGKEYTLNNHKGDKESHLQGAFDLICEAYDIEHRLTIPYTPQTNGMVERVNATVKNSTIKLHSYADAKEMNTDLMIFMIFYTLERKHSSLVTELRAKTEAGTRVKTPFEAMEYWYELDPKLFKETPVDFKAKLLRLRANL